MCKLSDRQLDNRAAKLQALEDEKRQLEHEIKTLKAEIVDAFEIAGPFKENTDKYRFNWFETVRPGVDVKRLQADMPDVYDHYKKESRFMQLRVTNIA